MNKKVELLNRLIQETENDKITWVKAPKSDIGWLSARDKWKGETILTPNKKLFFILNYSVHDYNYSEIEVYYVNTKDNTRTLVDNIEPGIFSFRTISKLKKLIKLVNSKEINKTNSPDIIGPQLPNKDWEEVVY